MRLQEVLNRVEGLEKRFVYYLESQGYIHPQKLQKARIARRDYSPADLERIRGIWHYYERGISVQRAYELVTRAAADGAYVFFPVPPRRWEDALALLRESDHVVEAEEMRAWVLIKVPAKRIGPLIEELREYPGIVEAAGIYGETDVIAKLEVPDQDALDELVVQRIQSIEAVESTRTFIAIGRMHWERGT
jgi:DNA-binding Lrp family transcriptional regulator